MNSPAEGVAGIRVRQATRLVAATARWLHIYLSLFAFGAMLLFSVTGLTLNHPEWFGAAAAVTDDLTGDVPTGLLGDPAADPTGQLVDSAAVAASIRSAHRITGRLADAQADDRDLALTWKGPGCSADAVVDRRSGRYTLSVTRHGLVAILNDFHKGRDTGAAWSLVIDVTAILLTLVAITGFALIFFIRRRRLAGLVTAAFGAVVVVAVAAWVLVSCGTG